MCVRWFFERGRLWGAREAHGDAEGITSEPTRGDFENLAPSESERLSRRNGPPAERCNPRLAKLAGDAPAYAGSRELSTSAVDTFPLGRNVTFT